MASTKPPSFSVYASFRSTRLVLRRRLGTFAEAAAYRREIAALRMHSRDNLLIVDDRTGDVIDADPGVVPITRPQHSVSGVHARLELFETVLEQSIAMGRPLADLPGVTEAIAHLEKAL